MSHSIGRIKYRRTAALTVLGVLAALVTVAVSPAAIADTSPPTGQLATVSADPLATVQIDGVAWAQVTVGNVVYVTGSFAYARPAGTAANSTSRVARTNLLAYDITTGLLITSFNHTLNAQGRSIAVSPDGARLYVGGQFTTVDGAAHNHLAAFNIATGALVTSFTPNLNSTVFAVAATNTAVYAGGAFTTGGGVARSYLAGYSSAGSLLSWNPGADAAVYAMALSPDQSRVIIGGRFVTLDGVARSGVGSVLLTGASGQWPANFPIADTGGSSNLTSLSTDSQYVYGTGYYFTTGGNFEGRFAADPNTGTLIWMNSCHGDSYDATPIGGILYSASHEHDCSDIGIFSQDNLSPIAATHHYLAAESIQPSGGTLRSPIYPGGGGPGPTYSDFSGEPDTTQLYWYPTLAGGTYTGQGQAAWSVSGNASYLSVGGEFPTANGVAQEGLVRYAIRSIAPNKIGPQAISTPTGRSQAGGSIRVSWQATWDQDNATLTYNLYRDGGSTPIYTTSLAGGFWKLPMLGYTDTGVTTGSAHTYVVKVTDPLGNSRTSSTSASVTVGTTVRGSYLSTLISDGASSVWRFSESSGTTTAFDSAGYTDLLTRSALTFGATGPITGQGTAATLTGADIVTTMTGGPPGAPPMTTTTSNSVAYSPASVVPLSTYTLEGWVKTTSTQGGALLTDSVLPAASGGQSSDEDRVLYFANDGTVHFGMFSNNSNRTIGSPLAYNDGNWHLVAATIGSGGANLYVDGVRVASNSALSDSAVFWGYWRVGGDDMSRWTPTPTSGYLAASVADVAVYPTALASTRILAHYQAAGGIPVNSPPTAAFTSSCTGLACSFDGSSSTDLDGTVTGYSWAFGDGTTGTGVTPSHTYTSAGTYSVTLTVTDNGGATGMVTHSVSVSSGTPVNSPPTAAFTSSCPSLACSFDGSSSTDSDGTVTGYSWAFGDGTTGTGVTPSHTYTSAGTYSVTLTVTDNGGATGMVTQSVAPANPAGTAFATDTFNRTVTAGFGTADLGGAWTTSPSSAFSVVPGTGSVSQSTVGSTQTAYLGSTSSSSADVTTTVALNKMPTSGTNGVYLDTIGRRVTTNQEYDGLVRFVSSGALSLAIRKLNGSTTATTLVAATAGGITYSPGTKLNVRFQADGVSPTTLRLKVWLNGTTEPTAWALTTTDSSTGLQAAGSVGFRSYLSSGATNTPVGLAFTAFSASPVD